MPITLTADTEARLREKAVQEGQDPNLLADTLLKMALEWEAQDRAEAIAGIKRGMEDFEQGRCRPFREFAAEQRVKYQLSSSNKTAQ